VHKVDIDCRLEHTRVYLATLQAALERGERLGELEERTAQMRMEAEEFSKGAHQLKNKYRDKKWYQFWEEAAATDTATPDIFLLRHYHAASFTLVPGRPVSDILALPGRLTGRRLRSAVDR